MIADKLRSCGAAKREIIPGVEHRSHKGLNNRVDGGHGRHAYDDGADLGVIIELLEFDSDKEAQPKRA